MSRSIDISDTHKEIVQAILREHLANSCHVWVFGSRATWLAKEYSDLDLAIARKDGSALPLTLMIAMETAFEDSLLPWKVDVVDLHSVSAEFRTAIERDKVLFSLGVGGEWKEVELANYCSKIGSGATPRGGNQVYLDKGIVSLIRSQNIHNDGFKKNGLVYISEEDADKLKNVIVENSDVLLNITGDSVARVCNASKELLPARVNQHVAIIRTNSTKLDPHFLRYILVSPSKQSLLLTLASAGATRNALTKNMIEKLTIQVPPLPEQKAIAHILGTLDDKIELNRQINQTLEAMAQALFQSWFVDFDPVIDKALAAGNEIPEAFQAKAAARQAMGDQRLALPEDVTALFPDAFVFTEEMGWIPAGWEVGKIKDLCEKVESGGTPSRKESNYWNMGTIPWLTSGEVNQDIIIKTKNFITSEGLKNSSAKIWPKMSTIVAMYGATAGKITLLACETSANQACCALIPKKNSKSFVYYKAMNSVSKYESRARGSAQQNLNKSIVSDLESLLPSKSILDRFEKETASILEKIISNKTMGIQIADLRDTLLPKLISGELRIADAEKFVGEVLT